MNTIPTSSSGRRLRWRLPLIAVLVAGLGGGGWLVLHAKDSNAVEKKTAKQEKKEDVFELTRADYATIEAGELRVQLPVSGTLTPVNLATVKSKVSAEVLQTLVQEGMAVSRGQPVVRLDTADLNARVATAQAALEEAKAKLSLAKKNRESSQALLAQKYISQHAFDISANQVEMAEANVKSAAAQLDIARRALDDATVRAPFDGIISKRLVQAGEKVGPDTPLFAMVNLRQLVFEAPVPASEIPRVKPGQAVSFEVDGYGERKFSGKVARINPTAEPGSRAMTVYIEVANADHALKGGMFARGGITLEKSAVKPLVPVAALRDENGTRTVYTIENDKIVAQPVKVGLHNEEEGMAEITSGLAPGSRVLLVKMTGVKPGSQVKLPDAAPARQASAVSGAKG